MRRILSIVLLLLFCLTALAGCVSSEEKTVLEVAPGSLTVPFDLYRFIVLGLREKHDQISDTWTPEDLDQLRADAADVVKEYYGVLSLCRDYRIDWTSDSFRSKADQIMEDTVRSYGGRDSFEKIIRANYMTYDLYEFLETCQLAQDELYYAMLRDGSIQTDPDTLRKIFASEEMIRIKQILIDPDQYPSKEAAREKAMEIWAEAREGADFDALINQYGDDLFMFNNQDGYYMVKGVWYHTFEDTAFSLEPGAVSEIIETPAGFSILKRYEKDSAYMAAHFDDLCQTYYDSVFSLAIEKRSAELSLSLTDFGSSLSLLELEMP